MNSDEERRRERELHVDENICDITEGESSALHAHEITKDDAAFLNMMKGAWFAPDVSITLPSGKTINGAEIMRWLESQ